MLLVGYMPNVLSVMSFILAKKEHDGVFRFVVPFVAVVIFLFPDGSYNAGTTELIHRVLGCPDRSLHFPDRQPARLAPYKRT